MKTKQRQKKANTGKLKIGDNWNAISIIAMSQNNPLKAIAEFIENSIDAQAKNITIIRGKERGEYYLKIIDDGSGIPLSEEGIPDFKYVATHICDSIKKRLKKQGSQGIQGEFGIGLLSFWTVGERLLLTSAGADGKTYQMEMKKNEPGYSITRRRALFTYKGTELIIHPLLTGIRQLTGEKIQNYMASELRDRIKKAGVKIKIKDRSSRKEFTVTPRKFTGILLHDLEPIDTDLGEIYFELYLNAYDAQNQVELSRNGTRILSSITKLDQFNQEPWSAGYLQGMIDVPFLTLTPGTRDGIIRDERFSVLLDAIKPVTERLDQVIEQEKKAAEEKTSKEILKTVQRALKEAFLALSREEYNWLDIYAQIRGGKKKTGSSLESPSEEQKQQSADIAQKINELNFDENSEPKFYKYAGPLYKAVITPASSVLKVGKSKKFRVLARDKSRRLIEHGIDVLWEIKEGNGILENTENEIVTFKAPAEPGITILNVTVKQQEIVCTAEAIVTITDTLLDKENKKGPGLQKGIPGYTFKRAPGELWRSHYDEKNNIIVINNGHADYIYSAKKRSRKIKYICKLYAKELVLHNFPGYSRNELLERMVELSMYTEEYLK